MSAESRTYDLVGNWNLVDGTQTFTPNSDNEYTSITGATSPVYDHNGNTLADESAQQYEYDWANRLITVRDDLGNLIASYTYDALNRRVTKTAATVTTRFVYSDAHVIEEYQNNILARSYVYGPGIDNPILLDDGTSAYYYLKDRQGSIIALADNTGAVIESYAYTAFGEMTIYNPSGAAITQSAYNNPYTYTGRRLDTESGLLYYRNRMYSASLGRFLSRDPAGYIDGMNLYAYVRNNPLLYFDPWGLSSIKLDSFEERLIKGELSPVEQAMLLASVDC